MDDRKAVKFYRSYYEVSKELPSTMRGRFIEAILAYQFEGIEPKFKGTLKLAWISQKHSLDKQLEGFKHGVKGGAPPKGTSNPPLKGTSNQEKEKGISISNKDKVKESIKKSRFAPPSLLEVQNYISEKGYSVNAENFIAFYDSNGWKVGKNPMKNWKAALRTWQGRQKEKNSAQKENTVSTLDKVLAVNKAIDNGQISFTDE